MASSRSTSFLGNPTPDINFSLLPSKAYRDAGLFAYTDASPDERILVLRERYPDYEEFRTITGYQVRLLKDGYKENSRRQKDAPLPSDGKEFQRLVDKLQHDVDEVRHYTRRQREINERMRREAEVKARRQLAESHALRKQAAMNQKRSHQGSTGRWELYDY